MHKVIDLEPRAWLDSQPMEGGDLVMHYLEQLGVEYVFGVPGGAIEPLYNALARSARRGGPRAVVARHETGAAFMADGYARESGRLGVCCATTGPGATNMITGVASAFDNRIPMLVLTAQTALPSFGRGAVQESSCTGVNTLAMFAGCTRYNTLVSHPEQLEHKLVAALMTALAPPRGPAHLSVPLDLLRTRVAARPQDHIAHLAGGAEAVDYKACAELTRRLAQARKPVLVVGEGAREAAGLLETLAWNRSIPLLCTPHGKGLVNPWHPCFCGVFGFAGHDSARAVLSDPDVDLVVAAGTGLGEWASDGWASSALLSERLVHVDALVTNLVRSPMASLHVIGHPAPVFEFVLERLRPGRLSGPRGTLAGAVQQAINREQLPFRLDDQTGWRADLRPLKPQRLMRELARCFPAGTRFFADNGNSMVWGIHYLHPRSMLVGGGRRVSEGDFRACLEFAPMGWAIGSAVGAAFADPRRPMVCITGDGSLLMSGQELTVAVQHHLPVVFVVLNDSALGMVRHGQRLGGAERIGYALPEVDLVAMAQAMGARGQRIDSAQDLLGLDVAAMLGADRPTLLDVRIDPDEVPPMAARVRALQGGV